MSSRRKVRIALSELQVALQRLYGKDAPAIVVYGSYARNQARAASDVDVLLLYSTDVRRGQEIRRVSPILSDLNLKYQLLISILPATIAEYRDQAGPFWANVRREGVGIDAV
jgi:uncharacterized protein